jgi:hypothetical protein
MVSSATHARHGGSQIEALSDEFTVIAWDALLRGAQDEHEGGTVDEHER